MIRVSPAVVCPMNFNLLCDQGQLGGVLKPTKNDHFRVVLVVWILFLRFLAKLKSGIYCNFIK